MQDFVLNFSKDKDISSNLALQKVKRMLKLKKAGYAGTLDPMANGILPIGFNKATKLLTKITQMPKEYSFTVVFGEHKDSLDATGKTTGTTNNIPKLQDIEQEIKSHFLGLIEQKPPIFSAVKIQGKRAYDLARKGEISDDSIMKPKQVFVEQFSVVEQIDNITYKFAVICGHGTYIRSLARDIAHNLGSLAYVSELTRERVGPFILGNAINIDTLSKIDRNNIPEEYMVDITDH